MLFSFVMDGYDFFYELLGLKGLRDLLTTLSWSVVSSFKSRVQIPMSVRLRIALKCTCSCSVRDPNGWLQTISKLLV